MMEKDKESIDQKALKQRANDAKIVRKVVFILLSIFILSFIFIGTFGYFYVKSGIGPVAEDSKEEVEIEIPLGSSTSDIAEILVDNGLIKNSTLFRFYIKFKNYADFQAGDYTLSPAMSLHEILEELQHGKVMEEPLFRVTIPEGKTVEQIATIFSKQMNFTEEEFIDTARSSSFIENMIGKYPNLLSKEVLNEDLYMPLEGYLFRSEELQHGKVMEEPLFRVTIPEGKTVEQIATIFSKQMNFTEEEFIDTARSSSFIENMIGKYPNLLSKEVLNEDLYMPLEGYLFASTYDIFDEELTAEQVIESMIERTNDILEEKVELIEESDYTIHEILTLASVIEREAKFPEDRPKVAQVYFNRLENGMKLQSDITAFYGLKNIEHKAVVTYDDLEVSTPYNTYKIEDRKS